MLIAVPWEVRALRGHTSARNKQRPDIRPSTLSFPTTAYKTALVSESLHEVETLCSGGTLSSRIAFDLLVELFFSMLV